MWGGAGRGGSVFYADSLELASRCVPVMEGAVTAEDKATLVFSTCFRVLYFTVKEYCVCFCAL